MPGLIINGTEYLVPGLQIENYNDIPGLEIKAPEDGRLRPAPPIGVLMHTTKGIPGGGDMRPQILHPGFGPNTKAGITMATWCRDNTARTSPNGGHHITVDSDGLISCHADLAKWAMFHGHTVNNTTIGIEMKQGADAGLYSSQLDTAVLLVDAITRILGIQRQIPDKYRGPLTRFDLAHGGRDYCGVYGHRDVTGQRGPGDPGDFIFDKFRAAGYESYNLQAGDDLKAWQVRQQALNLFADGQPGPKTRAALLHNHPHGLWVSRPGD